jgi:hypothetical protein
MAPLVLSPLVLPIRYNQCRFMRACLSHHVLALVQVFLVGVRATGCVQAPLSFFSRPSMDDHGQSNLHHVIHYMSTCLWMLQMLT